MIPLKASRARRFAVMDKSRISDALQDVVVSAITETLDYGIVLVDRHASVLFANATAHQFFRTNRMVNQCGALRAPTDGETSTLHQMIAQCCRYGAGGGEDAVAFCRVGYPQLWLQLMLVPPGSAEERLVEKGLVIIFMADPAKISPPRPHQLRQHFGLTAAEAILASQIVRGHGLKACAELIGISEPTARTHLRRIFEKTGTKRQAELVALIYGSRLAVRWPHPSSGSRETRSPETAAAGVSFATARRRKLHSFTEDLL
jgi:DNA-binding CsgD family transcriptional regulator